MNKISSHPSRLNPDLLEECNRLEIKRQLQDENLTRELVTKVQRLVEDKYPGQNLNISEEHVRTVLRWATCRLTRIEELGTEKFGFLWILPSKDHVDINKEVFQKLVRHLEEIETDEFEGDRLKSWLKEFSTENGVKFPELMKMLRAALSGLNEGPGVAEMMQLLGKCQSLERIKAVMG